MGSDWTRRLDPGEDLSNAHLRNGDGHLDRHVSGNAEPAILVGSLSLRMRVGRGNNTANHQQRNTQHSEQQPQGRPHPPSCVLVLHLSNIAHSVEGWESGAETSQSPEPDVIWALPHCSASGSSTGSSHPQTSLSQTSTKDGFILIPPLQRPVSHPAQLRPIRGTDLRDLSRLKRTPCNVSALPFPLPHGLTSLRT